MIENDLDDDYSCNNMMDTVGLLNKQIREKRPDPYVIRKLYLNLISDYATHKVFEEEVGESNRQELRRAVWKELLGVRASFSNEDLLYDKINNVPSDLENQRVITADAQRTRPSVLNESSQSLVTNILTYYCKVKEILYKQGMNEVLAPFVVLQTSEEDKRSSTVSIFQCFYSFMQKFLPNVYNDADFKSLQVSLRVFHQLIWYHDPKLAQALEQAEMLPEIYATPWFMTIFARNTEPELLFVLWDFLLVENDPFIIHFIALSFLQVHRTQVLSVSDIVTLPSVLTSLKLTDVKMVFKVCELAKTLVQATPASIGQLLHTVCFTNITSDLLPTLQQVELAKCLCTTAADVIENLRSLRSTEHSEVVEYFILDCREYKDYCQSHLSLSFHLDPVLVTNPEALEVLLEGFLKLSTKHFCFMGNAGEKNPTDDVDRLITIFLQRGFQYVSKVTGGFDAIKLYVGDHHIGKSQQLLSSIEYDERQVESENFITDKARRAANYLISSIRNSTEKKSTTTTTPSYVQQLVSAMKFKDHKWLSQQRQNHTEHHEAEKQVVLNGDRLGILFRAYSNKTKSIIAIVDSVVPSSVAASCQQIQRGDVLKSINGVDANSTSFDNIMAQLRKASMPVTLRFIIPKTSILRSMDAIALPLSAPVLLGTSPTTLSIMWEKQRVATKYQLQYAKRSTHYFNPWVSLGTVVATPTDKELQTSGTVHGLDPDSSYVFRVRCGREVWGPYSLSSAVMSTTELVPKNIKDYQEDVAEPDSPRRRAKHFAQAYFNAGDTPEVHEVGTYYYRVCVSLAVRDAPRMDSRAQNAMALHKGLVIRCSERLIRPGTNQVFVKLADIDGWAFENTEDGALVLERLSEYKMGSAINDNALTKFANAVVKTTTSLKEAVSRPVMMTTTKTVELPTFDAIRVDSESSEDDGSGVKCKIVVSPAYFAISNSREERIHLSRLQKITAKKNTKDLAIFHFTDSDGAPEQYHFTFSNDVRNECIEIVTRNYKALRTTTTP